MEKFSLAVQKTTQDALTWSNVPICDAQFVFFSNLKTFEETTTCYLSFHTI